MSCEVSEVTNCLLELEGGEGGSPLVRRSGARAPAAAVRCSALQCAGLATRRRLRASPTKSACQLPYVPLKFSLSRAASASPHAAVDERRASPFYRRQKVSRRSRAQRSGPIGLRCEPISAKGMPHVQRRCGGRRRAGRSAGRVIGSACGWGAARRAAPRRPRPAAGGANARIETLSALGGAKCRGGPARARGAPACFPWYKGRCAGTRAAPREAQGGPAGAAGPDAPPVGKTPRAEPTI